MSARPWITLLGGKEIARSATVEVAKAASWLQAPRGFERALALVRNEVTGEEHAGVVPEGGGNRVWRPVNHHRPAARQRFADAAVKEHLGPRYSARPAAGAAPTKHAAPARAHAFAARLPYKDD